MRLTIRIAAIVLTFSAISGCDYVSPIFDAIEEAIAGPPVATAVWARVGSSGAAGADGAFRAVAFTGGDRIVAVGYQSGTDPYFFPTGEVLLSGVSLGENATLVYYDLNGNGMVGALAYGADGSWFWGVDGDGATGAYAVGHQYGSGAYTYGTSGVSASGGSLFDRNSVLVRFDEAGVGTWAVVANGPDSRSRFRAVARFGTSHVYAAGSQRGTATFTYDTVDLTGGAMFDNATLVKFDSVGNAVWGVTTSAGLSSEFRAIAVDPDGSVYAAGYQADVDVYDYGGATAQSPCACQNGVLVKYDSAGNALWARTVSGGDGNSQFLSVAVDSAGDVYVAGFQSGSEVRTYGSISAQGLGETQNAILIKYDSAGNALWAQTPSAGPLAPDSYYASVAVSAAGFVYASGSQQGTEPYAYGEVVVTAANSNDNAALAKFDLDGNPIWATSTSEASDLSSFVSVAVSDDLLVVGGNQQGDGVFQYGSVPAEGNSEFGNHLVGAYLP